ncbi:MAG: S1 RNA-binding domain-containing protein [Anaerolineae bacterium]|nr:S1 RNA-binding domain-containing protein [Anaerolineae bacterium]
MSVAPAKARIDLTLIEPHAYDWNELKVGDVVTGEVVRIEKFGVFLEIGAERPGMIHVSELANGYISDPTDVVKMGDSVEAKLIGVNRRKKQIDLSVRALEMPTEEELADEDEEAPLNPMELALRRALEQSASTDLMPSKGTKADRKRKKQRSNQNSDIIARTLRMHDNQ